MGKTLIVGGDSFIGSGLAARLASGGLDILATTRRSRSGQSLPLELSEWADFPVPERLDAAVLCAGTSGFKACETCGEAERVNTVFLPALAERLLRAGAFTIMLSSSAVFGNDVDRPSEDAPLSPGTTYGKHKAQAERKIMQGAAAIGASDLACVIRLTKVVDAAKDPVASWLGSWRTGKPARAFSDVRTSPITLDYLGAALRIILSKRKAGIWHLSGAEGISYADFCRRLALRLGVDSGLAGAAASKEFGVDAPFRPVDGALDMASTTRAAGIAPQPLDDVVGELCRKIGNGGL